MTTEQFSQEQAERERFGLLVNPDLTYRRIVFDEDTARETLGGITANAGLGLALVLVAPAMSRGEPVTGRVDLSKGY